MHRYCAALNGGTCAPLLRRLERRNVVHTAGLQGSQRRTEPRRAGVGSGALFIGNFWTARAALLFSTFIKCLIINKQNKKTQRQLATYHIELMIQSNLVSPSAVPGPSWHRLLLCAAALLLWFCGIVLGFCGGALVSSWPEAVAPTSRCSSFQLVAP